VIAPNLRERMATIVPWDSWDPDIDRWEFDPQELAAAANSNPERSEGSTEQSR
jgi:hypothetical protein